MRKIFSFLSLLSTLLGLSIIISMSQGGNLLDTLTFGANAIFIFNLYPLLGLLFALPAEKNRYREILIICSIIILAVSLIFTFVGLFGFQEP
ncbi:hypothetical protein [Bacillus suaedae]|uniref:Uncharacterized protein n=1 Tax=Halalkalibacter suaedae TaxID=2822140 RepID=A0A940WPZ8_9BACI|nr:hypothetical protein [Bacillus suaedae]MBP3950206.1 hypothetical protein [Bacillus suaedae]